MKEFKGKNFCFPLSNRTFLMGILNITENSFSDTGKYADAKTAVAHALSMQGNGADIIDIGAQSTAPGREDVTAEEEIERLSKVLPELSKTLSVPISVDTFHTETALYALENGACIINDVSGVFNPEMAKIVAEHGCGWIITHGISSEVESPLTDMELINSISSFFASVLASCQSFGIKKEQICFDVGIGFGKSREGDLTVLRELKRLVSSKCAMLVGASRKRFIEYASGETVPEKRVFGTVAANTAAIAAGADILRVHDVAEALQGAKVADALFRTRKETIEGIIQIRDLKIFAYHGVNPEEKKYGQNFLIDLDVYSDFSKASDSDDIESTVSYAKVIKRVRSIMTEDVYDLIETVAKKITDGVFDSFPAVNRVHVVLKKPDAPIKAEFSYVAVETDECR